jgi:hypothetical protein
MCCHDERSYRRQTAGSRRASYCLLKSLVTTGALDVQGPLPDQYREAETLGTMTLAIAPIVLISRSYCQNS